MTGVWRLARLVNEVGYHWQPEDGGRARNSVYY
uniref:Uncharacterized protein n=1 Tax=Arundo donax TaxID=35708 RepID=A0A0A8XTT5_ARUDO